MSFEYNNETWRTEGSEYIGLDVSFGSWSGKIIGWLPPDSAGLNRYLVKYTDGVKEERNWLSEVDDWLTEESKQLLERRRLEQRRLEQRRLEQRRLEPEEGVAHDVAKKKRKAATPAPAPTTTTMTTTASTTDKTRACKKKKQPKDERNPASKILDLLQMLFDVGDLCLLTLDEGRSEEHDKKMATTGEIWKKLKVKANGESREAMEKLGYVKELVPVFNKGYHFKQEKTGKFIHFDNIPSDKLKKEKPPAAEEANYVPGCIEIQGNLEEERLNPSLKNVIHNLMIMEDKLGFAYSGGYTVQRAKDTGQKWSNVLAIKLHGCACGKRDKFKGGYVLISQPIHITRGVIMAYTSPL